MFVALPAARASELSSGRGQISPTHVACRARALRRPFEPEFSVQVARCVTAVIGKFAPVRAAKVPGRNDPCICGSGKKFKRCCADGGGAATDPT